MMNSSARTRRFFTTGKCPALIMKFQSFRPRRNVRCMYPLTRSLRWTCGKEESGPGLCDSRPEAVPTSVSPVVLQYTRWTPLPSGSVLVPADDGASVMSELSCSSASLSECNASPLLASSFLYSAMSISRVSRAVVVIQRHPHDTRLCNDLS